MGSGMAKCSSSETYYKRRRGTQNVDSCFAKEYSEYWNKDKRKGTFGMERNEYNFNSGNNYDNSVSRRQSSFVSSFSAENSTTSSGNNSTNSSQRNK